MAQVVKPDMGQVVLLQQLVEGVTHIVGGVGVPVLPGKHVVVVYVVLAIMVAVVLLLLKQDFEQSHRIVCQGKAAEAGCVFGFVLLHDLRDPGHSVPYGQRLHRKVDAVPFQPQYLAAAQTVQRGDVDDGVEAFVLNSGQQVSHLRFGVERAGKLRRVGHDDQISWVCLNQTVPLRQFERLIEHVLVLTQANRGEAVVAVRTPEFGLYVDIRLQRLAVNVAQPDLQVIEVGKDVCLGLYLVALVGDLVHAMPDILQPAAHGVTEKHIGRGSLLRLFAEHVKHELPGFALVPCY